MDGLWEAARRFSQEQAYPGQAFPVVENGAHCVLCQQDLDHAASHRLRQFEAFVASTTERELRQVRETFARLRKTFIDLKTTTEAIDETLKEIRIEHEAVADAIAAALATNENRRKAVVLALTEDKDLAADCPALVSVAREADALAEQLEARVKTLRTSATDETRKRMTAEAQELRARKLLAKHEQMVLNEIERKKKYRRLRAVHRRDEDQRHHAEEHGRHEDGRFAKAQAELQGRTGESRFPPCRGRT